MRRTTRAAIAAALAAAFIIVPLPAVAAPAPPPPVWDIPGTASQIIKMAPTWNDVKAGQVWRAMIDLATKPGNTIATIPKPITQPSPMTRPAAGGVPGAVLTSFMGGWAIGQGGLSLYGAISGKDQNKLQCDHAPDWFNAVNNFLTFGLASSCNSVVQNPNADVEAWTPIALNGYTISKPTFNGQTPAGIGTWCYKVNFKQNNSYIDGSNPRVYTFVYGSVNGNPPQWNNYTIGGTTMENRCTGSGAGITANDTVPWTMKNLPLEGPYIIGMSTKLTIPTGEAPEAAAKIRTDTDPIRKASCKIKWRDGTTTTGDGLAYQEATGMPMNSTGLGCEKAYFSKPGAGPDLLPEEITVESTDTTTGAKTEISNQPVPAFSPTEALPLKPGNGRGLVLEKVVDGVSRSCMTWEADCTQWWTKTNAGTVPGTSDGTYRCTYGGTEIGLSECGPYRGTFDTKTDAPTITDPITGGQIPWTNKPSMNTTNPGEGIDPGGECMSEWATVPNPIEFVLHPVKCALVWAFVPRASVVTQTQTAVATAFAPTIFGQLPAVVGTALAVPTGMDGCTGPQVNIPIHLWGINIDYSGHPLSACAEPMSTLAGWSRSIAAAIIIWMTGLGIIRRASATVNAPGIGSGSS